MKLNTNENGFTCLKTSVLTFSYIHQPFHKRQPLNIILIPKMPKNHMPVLRGSSSNLNRVLVTLIRDEGLQLFTFSAFCTHYARMKVNRTLDLL